MGTTCSKKEGVKPSFFIITVIKKRYLKQQNSNKPVSNVVKMSSNLGVEEKENLLNH
jgi:hypothetical protein